MWKSTTYKNIIKHSPWATDNCSLDQSATVSEELCLTDHQEHGKSVKIRGRIIISRNQKRNFKLQQIESIKISVQLTAFWHPAKENRLRVALSKEE